MPETPPPPPSGPPEVQIGGDTKGYLIDVVKELLLDQHLHPTGGDEKLTRFEQGVREGKIATYLDVILNLPMPPTYDTSAETLRVMLLGQALTDHVSS